MKKTNKKYFWYGLVAVTIGSFNPTAAKIATEKIDPLSFNTLRYCIASVVLFPFFLVGLKYINKKNLKYSVLSGFCLSVATISFIHAIDLSKATYVSLLMLMNPISMVYLSHKLTKDKVSHQRMFGFSLAALGALIVIAGPLIASQNTELDFYPVATLFLILNAITYPLAIIFMRKAIEGRKKLPITSVAFVQVTVIAGLSILARTIIGNETSVDVDFLVNNKEVLVALLYSGIMVGIIDRSLNARSYKHVGSAVNGGLVYFGLFLAVIISMLLLNESLSLIAIIGGAIILLGVIFTEHKLPKKHRHHHHFFHHK